MSLPVALIHGWGMNSASWEHLLAIKGELDLIPLDLPGHGNRLDETLPGSIDVLAQKMLSQAPDEAIWCGWSLGSLVAMRAAGIAPERVRGLILVAPTPRFVNGEDWKYGMNPDFFQTFSAAVARDPATSLKRFVLMMFEGCEDARQKSRAYLQNLQKNGTANAANLAAGLQILLKTDLRSQLHGIEQPVHLLAGRQDTICPPSAAQWLHRELGWPLQEVDTGHAPQLSHPRLITEIIDKIEQELYLV